MIIFRKLYSEYINIVPIIPDLILPIIFSYLFPPDRDLKEKSEFLYHAQSLTISRIPKLNVFLSDERKKGFKCSHFLNRADEMQIKLAACRHTVDWISNKNEVPDLYGWVDFKQHYTVRNRDLTNESSPLSQSIYIFKTTLY